MRISEVRKGVEVVVRPFDEAIDRCGAEAVEEMCEVGPTGKLSLYTDLLGDPLARVRHSPAFLMLVAETVGPEPEIVGLVRGCIKTVTCTATTTTAAGGGATPVYTKLAYILGLRVSPAHRRMRIGLKLVEKMEEWFRSMGAEYAYMATDRDNAASVGLFTGRCGYSKFRTPSILVQPVFAHRLRRSNAAAILRLSPATAEQLYRQRLSTVEFFPRDIDAVLNNPLSLGTFIAVPASYAHAGAEALVAALPPSWAVLSVWNCKEVFRMQVRGAGRLRRGAAAVTRAVDRAMPWLRVPAVPDLFRPFGFCFLYGIGGEGEAAATMMKALCRHAHDMARAAGCGVVAAEVAACDPLRAGIPHWRRLSCEEDLWCIKRLADGYGNGGAVGDWTKAPAGRSIFVDPRET